MKPAPIFHSFSRGTVTSGLSRLAGPDNGVRKTSKIKVARVLSRLPFLGNFVKIYLTAYYAREWGSLIGQGLELGQIVTIMQEQPSALFQEIGRDLAQALTRGQGFCDQVLTYPFFRRELSLIIEYGQVKSKLGAELSLYADECWEEFSVRSARHA